MDAFFVFNDIFFEKMYAMEMRHFTEKYFKKMKMLDIPWASRVFTNFSLLFFLKKTSFINE